MFQWRKVLAAKLDTLSSILRTHMVEGENRVLKIAPCPPQACHGASAPTHTNSSNK